MHLEEDDLGLLDCWHEINRSPVDNKPDDTPKHSRGENGFCKLKAQYFEEKTA